MKKGGDDNEKKEVFWGVDLNEKSCQISYYDENKEEPETMEAAVDNYQIPLILGYYKDRWVYGQEAKRLKEAGEGDIVTHLFRKAVKRKKVRVGERYMTEYGSLPNLSV